jgi:transcriptional regulator with XRE-family HTH domain
MRVKGPKRVALKRWRWEAGLTQAQLAEKLGMSTNNLIRIENGGRPRFAKVIKLEEITGLSREVLFPEVYTEGEK